MLSLLGVLKSRAYIIHFNMAHRMMYFYHAIINVKKQNKVKNIAPMPSLCSTCIMLNMVLVFFNMLLYSIIFVYFMGEWVVESLH